MTFKGRYTMSNLVWLQDIIFSQECGFKDWSQVWEVGNGYGPKNLTIQAHIQLQFISISGKTRLEVSMNIHQHTITARHLSFVHRNEVMVSDHWAQENSLCLLLIFDSHMMLGTSSQKFECFSQPYIQKQIDWPAIFPDVAPIDRAWDRVNWRMRVNHQLINRRDLVQFRQQCLAFT